MEERGSRAESVEQVGIDRSPSYIAACKDKLPNAQIVFDRFYIEQMRCYLGSTEKLIAI